MSNIEIFLTYDSIRYSASDVGLKEFMHSFINYDETYKRFTIGLTSLLTKYEILDYFEITNEEERNKFFSEAFVEIVINEENKFGFYYINLITRKYERKLALNESTWDLALDRYFIRKINNSISSPSIDIEDLKKLQDASDKICEWIVKENEKTLSSMLEQLEKEGHFKRDANLKKRITDLFEKEKYSATEEMEKNDEYVRLLEEYKKLKQESQKESDDLYDLYMVLFIMDFSEDKEKKIIKTEAELLTKNLTKKWFEYNELIGAVRFDCGVSSDLNVISERIRKIGLADDISNTDPEYDKKIMDISKNFLNEIVDRTIFFKNKCINTEYILTEKIIMSFIIKPINYGFDPLDTVDLVIELDFDEEKLNGIKEKPKYMSLKYNELNQQLLDILPNKIEISIPWDQLIENYCLDDESYFNENIQSYEKQYRKGRKININSNITINKDHDDLDKWEANVQAIPCVLMRPFKINNISKNNQSQQNNNNNEEEDEEMDEGEKIDIYKMHYLVVDVCLERALLKNRTDKKIVKLFKNLYITNND